MTTHTISDGTMKKVLSSLKGANDRFAAWYPGESPARQPVQTVYGGAHLFKADDVENTDYSLMTNQMVCNDLFGHPSSIRGYKCLANFSISGETTENYIRCADQPWYEGTINESMRNLNTEDTPYVLRKPLKKIEIDAIQPFNDIEIVTEFASFDLKVQTSGGGDFHQCFYSFSGYENMIEFSRTGINKNHVQPLQPPPNEYEIFVKCKDETGDTVQSSTSFEIIYDDSVPIITRIWNDDGEIFIITDSPAECRYSMESCSFSWSNATIMSHVRNTHVLNSVSGEGYFVKCKDINGNVPTSCSVNFVAVPRKFQRMDFPWMIIVVN